MTLALCLVVACPAIAAVGAWGVRSLRAQLAVLLAVAAVHLASTAVLWRGHLPMHLGSLVGMDALALLVLSLVSVLFLSAALYCVPYLLEGTHDAAAAPQ